MSGQGDPDKLSLRCAELEFASCMYAERIDQIRCRIEVMREREGVEKAAFRGTPDIAHKTLYVERAECRSLVVNSLRGLSLHFNWKHRAECAAIAESEYRMRAITILSLLHTVFYICDFIYLRMKSNIHAWCQISCVTCC